MSSKSRAVVCPRCRQLISVEETRCPFCGAPPASRASVASGLTDVLDFDIGWALIVACVVMFVGALVLDPSALAGSTDLFSLLGPTSRSLYQLGMTGGLAWQEGDWWTLLTASFLHGGLIHIFFNLSWLRQIYPLLEHHFGKAGALVIYYLSGAGGFLLSNLVSGTPTIGASAALFGIFGALVGWGRRRGGTYGANLSSVMWSTALPPFLMGFLLPNVNNWGHLGGFVSGFALAWIIPIDPKRQGAIIPALAIALTALTLVGFALSAWRMTSAMDAMGL
jgi:rhomboid protease GluP